MKRVLLSGYYGMDNSGDDALLAVSAWGAKTYLHADRIYVTAKSIPRFEGSGFLTPIFTPSTRFRGENRIRGAAFPAISQQVVFGGGSVFHSTDILKAQTRTLKLAGDGDHAAVGVSIGPFRDGEAEKACAELLKRLRFIGLRDSESLDIARSICPSVHSEKTFDLAPLLPRTANLSLDTLADTRRRGIGVSLCDYDRYVGGDPTRDTARKARIAQMLEVLLAQDAAGLEEIVFIDFNGNPDCGDRHVHEEAAQAIGDRVRIRHLRYASDPAAVLRTIAGLRVMVAMRLHAAVFAYLARTPTVMLSYHAKCLGWAAEIGLPPELVFDCNDIDPSLLAATIRAALSGTTRLATLPPADAERAALGNWEWTHG